MLSMLSEKSLDTPGTLAEYQEVSPRTPIVFSRRDQLYRMTFEKTLAGSTVVIFVPDGGGVVCPS